MINFNKLRENTAQSILSEEEIQEILEDMEPDELDDLISEENDFILVEGFMNHIKTGAKRGAIGGAIIGGGLAATVASGRSYNIGPSIAAGAGATAGGLVGSAGGAIGGAATYGYKKAANKIRQMVNKNRSKKLKNGNLNKRT